MNTYIPNNQINQYIFEPNPHKLLQHTFHLISPHHAPNHLWHYDHIPDAGLDGGRFLIGQSLFFGFAEILDETLGVMLETVAESMAATSADELD